MNSKTTTQHKSLGQCTATYLIPGRVFPSTVQPPSNGLWVRLKDCLQVFRPQSSDVHSFYTRIDRRRSYCKCMSYILTWVEIHFFSAVGSTGLYRHDVITRYTHYKYILFYKNRYDTWCKYFVKISFLRFPAHSASTLTTSIHPRYNLYDHRTSTHTTMIQQYTKYKKVTNVQAGSD